MRKVAIIIRNDNQHSIEYFAKVVHNLFHYSYVYCYWLALKASILGKTIVWIGTKELAELKVMQIENSMPDSKEPCIYPFSCVIIDL